MKMNQFPINETVYTPNWNVCFLGGAFDRRIGAREGHLNGFLAPRDKNLSNKPIVKSSNL